MILYGWLNLPRLNRDVEHFSQIVSCHCEGIVRSNPLNSSEEMLREKTPRIGRKPLAMVI
ncbi:MAG: hypothetical protein QY317_06385 [Candidatus Jettenia caeni]|nr:MAG: hypothetical protein QY317_06385 [Candidatus Jettenia caeni]